MANLSIIKNLINKINIGFAKENVGDYVVDSIETLKDAVENQTFSGKATADADGLMSKEDFAKLAGIEPEANKYELPAATQADLGGVKQAAAVPDAESETVLDTVNALLASLRAAGIMAESAE